MIYARNHVMTDRAWSKFALGDKEANFAKFTDQIVWSMVKFVAVKLASHVNWPIKFRPEPESEG